MGTELIDLDDLSQMWPKGVDDFVRLVNERKFNAFFCVLIDEKLREATDAMQGDPRHLASSLVSAMLHNEYAASVVMEAAERYLFVKDKASENN